jgi:tRNA A-37 threonylcarbamoyl transferase component Bud32
MDSNEKPIRSESSKPNVILRNEPKLSEREGDNDLNKMRTEFVPYIQDFVTEHDLFKNETEVGIEFAHKGISSVIAIIDTPAGKWVLKIPRNKTHTVGEAQFFQVWKNAGVTVPHIIETGELNSSPYTLMEYIDAPTLDTCYSHEELLTKGIFVEMGKVLRLMHSESADGYGFVVDGKPEFETVEEWLEGDDLKNRFDYINEHNLLEGIEDELDKVLEAIKQHSKNSDSTYCHDDFGTANIFATDPITIFDAQPRFNSGYYDLGKIKFLKVALGGSDESLTQLLEGYFGDDDCDDDTLNAYTFLFFVYKCPYWKKTGRDKELEIVKNYFKQNPIR